MIESCFDDMSALQGLNVQKSRFSVLSLSQDSESEEDSSLCWVTQPKSKGPNKKAKGSAGAAKGNAEGGKGCSKSAKKRARKKRNKSISLEQTVSGYG